MGVRGPALTISSRRALMGSLPSRVCMDFIGWKGEKSSFCLLQCCLRSERREYIREGLFLKRFSSCHSSLGLMSSWLLRLRILGSGLDLPSASFIDDCNISYYWQEISVISLIREFLHFLIELSAALVLGSLPDGLVDPALFTPIYSIVVEPGVDVVEVMEAFYFVYSAAGKFHQGEVHDHVVGAGIELALLVLEVFLLDFEEEFCTVGSEMGEPLRRLPVVPILFVVCGVLGGETQHDVPALVVPEEVGVHHPSLVLLVACIEGLQHVLAYELVVGIQVEHYCVGTAVVVGSGVYVFEGGLPLFVLDVGVGIFVDLVEVQVLPVDLIGVVDGGVVDDDHEVVGVILLEDGVEVVLDAELGVVIVARDHDAHWQFLVVLAEVPDLVDAFVFLCFHPLLFLVSAVVEFVVEGGKVESWEVLFVGCEGGPLFLELLADGSVLVLVEDFVDAKHNLIPTSALLCSWSGILFGTQNPQLFWPCLLSGV